MTKVDILHVTIEEGTVITAPPKHRTGKAKEDSTHPNVVKTNGVSLANLRAAAHKSIVFFGGSSLVRINKHEMRSSPAIMPAFARAAVAKPKEGLLSMLLSMIGCTIAPNDDPDATIVIASARRF